MVTIACGDMQRCFTSGLQWLINIPTRGNQDCQTVNVTSSGGDVHRRLTSSCSGGVDISAFAAFVPFRHRTTKPPCTPD